MARSLALLGLIFVLAGVAAAQGGKAEPRRIEIVAGKSSAALTGSLTNGQEMEYVFKADAGQKVTVKNAKTSLFDVRIFSREADVETEFDSSPTLALQLPQSGDYMLFIRKKQVKAPKTARFSVVLEIK